MLGGSGQDAFYLAMSLSKMGHTIFWLYRSNIEHLRDRIKGNVEFIQVSKYSYEFLQPYFRDLKLDAVISIVGAVGNRSANTNPIATYSDNLNLAIVTVSLIEKYCRDSHLYYFSTSDIDGRVASEPFHFDPYQATSPISTYGMSKLHATNMIRFLMTKKVISSTIIYLGMHESFYRSGSYVLSKIKDIVLEEDVSRLSADSLKFGNLNVNLDLGHAEQYMKLLSKLIDSQFSQEAIFIGTGEYTNLLNICQRILVNFGLDADLIDHSSDSFVPRYYPLMPDELIDYNLNSSRQLKPVPFSAKIFKDESTTFLKYV